jgi:hypothetical protein
MTKVVILSVGMLNVIMLNVVKQSVVTPFKIPLMQVSRNEKIKKIFSLKKKKIEQPFLADTAIRVEAYSLS